MGTSEGEGGEPCESLVGGSGEVGRMLNDIIIHIQHRLYCVLHLQSIGLRWRSCRKMLMGHQMCLEGKAQAPMAAPHQSPMMHQTSFLISDWQVCRLTTTNQNLPLCVCCIMVLWESTTLLIRGRIMVLCHYEPACCSCIMVL